MNNSVVSEMVYPFLSSRSVMMWPRGTSLLPCDARNELGVSFQDIVESYNKMVDYSAGVGKSAPRDDLKKEISEFNNFRAEAEDAADSGIRNNAMRFLFRISAPMYSIAFAQSLGLESVIGKMSCVTFSGSGKLDSAIRSSIALSPFLSIPGFFDYYTECRRNSLESILSKHSLRSLSYSPRSGFMYFSIPLELENIKEQIFSDMREAFFGNSPISLEEVLYMIQTSHGEISRSRSVFSKRERRRFETVDMLSPRVPIVIRKVLHGLMEKYAFRWSKTSYQKLLSEILRSSIFCEDFCIQDDLSGRTMLVPINGSWERMSSPRYDPFRNRRWT